ncbi:AMIN domain-containing protein [Hydrogenophilus thermoluteolus]|uniref:AMIN domain-containing protein n=1 Tax=Hydrogenophilus thermoluteolus TaxID=297 RepID=UPI003F680158
MRFPDVRLPDLLHRRSDVRDFGTPVTELRFAQKGRDAVLSVWAKGDWQPTAYQADTTFVLEIAEPPKRRWTRLPTSSNRNTKVSG